MCRSEMTGINQSRTGNRQVRTLLTENLSARIQAIADGRKTGFLNHAVNATGPMPPGPYARCSRSASHQSLKVVHHTDAGRRQVPATLPFEVLDGLGAAAHAAGPACRLLTALVAHRTSRRTAIWWSRYSRHTFHCFNRYPCATHGPWPRPRPSFSR